MISPVTPRVKKKLKDIENSTTTCEFYQTAFAIDINKNQLNLWLWKEKDGLIESVFEDC